MPCICIVCLCMYTRKGYLTAAGGICRRFRGGPRARRPAARAEAATSTRRAASDRRRHDARQPPAGCVWHPRTCCRCRSCRGSATRCRAALQLPPAVNGCDAGCLPPAASHCVSHPIGGTGRNLHADRCRIQAARIRVACRTCRRIRGTIGG